MLNIQFEPIENISFGGRNNGFSYTVVTSEIILIEWLHREIEWQQNHRAPWLPEFVKINIVLHYFSSETVQVWLK